MRALPLFSAWWLIEVPLAVSGRDAFWLWANWLAYFDALFASHPGPDMRAYIIAHWWRHLVIEMAVLIRHACLVVEEVLASLDDPYVTAIFVGVRAHIFLRAGGFFVI